MYLCPTDVLRKVSLAHIVKRQQIANNVVARRPLRPQYRRFNGQLRQLWRDLDNNVVTVEDFIRRAGNMVGGLVR